MIELKPCPFCGGKAELQNDNLNFEKINSYVVCSECNTKTKKYSINTAYSSDEMATEAWNRRANEQTN